MSGDQPNVLLVTIDSLRADHCGFLGSDRGLTPTLDSLADRGVVFENAIAPGPRTPSSMPAVFTGEVFGPRPNLESRTLDHRKSRISSHLARYRTVAERLRERGYNTAGVTTNPWTQYLPGADFGKGFDTFGEIDGSDLFDGDVSEVPRWLRATDWLLDTTGVGERYNWRWKKDWFIQWPQIYDVISEQIHSTDSPSFCWVFLLDTHEPYLSSPRDREENNALQMYHAVLKDKLDSSDGADLSGADRTRLRQAYRDATRSVDRFMETVLGECTDDTVVVFHSDHGEAFGEHGTWGHKSDLYAENLRVPFLISGEVPSDRVSDLVSLRDLPGMIADLAGDPEGFDAEQHTRSVVYATTEGGGKRALRTRGWKCIVGPEQTELYSLADDPREQTDLSDRYPEAVDLFRRLDRAKRSRTVERASIAAGAREVSGI